MAQISLDILKTLIEINGDINSDYSNKDALLFRILKWAMRLVKCERSAFLSLDRASGKFILNAVAQGSSFSVKSIVVTEKSFAGAVREKRKSLVANDVTDDTYHFSLTKGIPELNISSLIAVPVFVGERLIGVVEAIDKSFAQLFDDNDLRLMELLAGVAGTAIDAADNISRQKNEITSLRRNLKKSSETPTKFHKFIAESPVIQDLMEIVKKAAVTNSSVLITGESGVGKELFAEQIYLNSLRNGKPFIRVNCAALSETLMESELFGHVKGAYTSADSAQDGRFKMADGGTIFLDEVGEIPLSLQPKLLRVIQDKQFEMVGSTETICVDVRIIAATNRNLDEMVQQGKFREDLYFRLNVLPIRVPPLRARKEDILPLAKAFLHKYSIETGRTYFDFSEHSVKAMEDYRWPGNIRELENAIARACIIGTPPVIRTADLRLTIPEKPEDFRNSGGAEEIASVVASTPAADRTLKNALNVFKRAYLIKILEECSWNQTRAGKILGIQRTYVSRLMNELNVREERK